MFIKYSWGMTFSHFDAKLDSLTYRIEACGRVHIELVESFISNQAALK